MKLGIVPAKVHEGLGWDGDNPLETILVNLLDFFGEQFDSCQDTHLKITTMIWIHLFFSGGVNLFFLEKKTPNFGNPFWMR